MWAFLPCPVIRQFDLFLVRFLLMLAIETFNVNDDMVFKCVRLVQILPWVLYVGRFSSHTNKTICSFFSTFPLIASNWDFECKWRYDVEVCQDIVNTNATFLDVGMSFLHCNKTICSFFSAFPLIAGSWDFECKWRYDVEVCQVIVNTNATFLDVGMPFLHRNKTICSFFSLFSFIAGYWEFQF